MTTAWQRHGWLKQLSENSLQWIPATTHNSQYETISNMKWNWHNLEYVINSTKSYVCPSLGRGWFLSPIISHPPCPWALRFCLIMFERTSPGVFTSAYSASEAPISHWPSQEPIYWRYLPYIRPICQAYVREYPHKIWPYMVQYLHFRILKIINGWWMQPPSFRKREDVLNYYNLVGGWPTPLKNMTSSVGMMTFPIYI